MELNITGMYLQIVIKISKILNFMKLYADNLTEKQRDGEVNIFLRLLVSKGLKSRLMSHKNCVKMFTETICT